jgi:hypothetical protein
MSAAAPVFTFNEEFHEYRVGSQVVPACTAVLADGGLVPRWYVSEDVLERKSALGREAHKACHLHNLEKLGEYDPRVKPYLRAWINFKMATSFQLIASEFQTVATVNGMQFGMKLDCQALIDGAETIIELKCGAVYPHHGIQTAGYAAGLPHAKYTAPLARFMARKRIVVELRANGFPKVHRFEDRSDYEVFASLLYVTSWKRRHENVYVNQKLKESI